MNESSNNVIKFPLTTVAIDLKRIQNDEQLKEKFFQNKKFQADMIVEAYSEQLINRLTMHGFDTHEEDFLIYFTFVTEALRLCLYSNLAIDGGLIQKDIDECIKKIEKRENSNDLDLIDNTGIDLNLIDDD
jgi:hypothetical protein